MAGDSGSAGTVICSFILFERAGWFSNKYVEPWSEEEKKKKGREEEGKKKRKDKSSQEQNMAGGSLS